MQSIIHKQLAHDTYNQADIFIEADIQLLHYSLIWQWQAGVLFRNSLEKNSDILLQTTSDMAQRNLQMAI